MRKFSATSLAFCFAVFFSFNRLCAYAQDGRVKAFPTDASLHQLVNKYLQSPIVKTTAANGDVFLQRDMSGYLSAKFAAPEPAKKDQDFGHDHKDEMLRTFLNRPHPSVATLNKYFDEAAAEFNVPAPILKAVAQVQSNWAQVSESIYGSWGVMGLIENKYTLQISGAAKLLNTSANAIKNNAQTNIRAAAALLKEYQKNNPSTTLEDWFDAVKSLTGLWDETQAHSLALRIYEVLQTGSKTVSLWDEIISLEGVNVSLPRSLTEKPAPTNTQRTMAVDYPLAVSNFTTCNYNSRPAGSPIKFYFVHYVATGTYQGAISWFKDCSSQVSAHYVVRNNDGEVSQVVQETDRAWSQGVTLYNDQGIGVEHEVLATNLSMWDSDPMLNAAAALCKNVCNRRGIPTVRRVNNGDMGIYGHSDVRSTDCPNLTPARWTNFLNRVNAVTVAAPTLYTVTNPGTGTQISATWKANIEPTLAGYRLYYATNDALTAWALAANETTLTAATTSLTLDASQFIVPPAGNVYHFKLTAVANDGSNLVEGPGSDVYSRSSNTAGPKVLIVDGFDRFGGSASYANSTHAFATNYFKALRNNASLQINTVADEKVADGTVSLSPYNLVVWFSGDESSSPLVLSAAERTALKSYLDGGGKLFITGSEIAYNVGRSGGAAYDLAFMNNYLKSNYAADGSSTYTPATGLVGTAFEGLKVPFGFVYHEDFPDAVNAVAGATNILAYNGVTNRAGVAYKGTFGTGTVSGGVVYLSFTLETAVDTVMTAVMGKTLTYFDVPVGSAPIACDDAANAVTRTAKRVAVLSNDFTNGSLFNPSSVTIVSQPANGTATVESNGAITYVSNVGFTGTDSYKYAVQNSGGQTSNVATVSLNVTAPIACNPTPPEGDDAAPKRDLRGAWVSTVFNLDWPSSRTLTTAQQQAELNTMLDNLAQTGINTVFFQVRPESDALYASTIEPWSYWLTNAQGTAPNPFWDPLAYAIDAAHARGMELHAWMNPFRAKQSTPTLAPNHVASLHPEWTFINGTVTLLNPGLLEVRTYLTQVVADIASRYDVDGIHFDDYFYPSGMASQDAATYTANNPAGIATVADWRRWNTQQLITRVYDTIAMINAASNRNIVFGVSPFGIWKSGTPVGISGSSSYTDMYYDPIAWMQAGKVDYVAPQLYWIVGGPQDYNNLSKWWNDQGLAANRYIYPGLAAYRLADASNWAASEIEGQINVNRDAVHEQVRGQILFRAKNITDNAKGIKTSLQNGQFKYKAIPPAMLWKDAVCPNAPVNVRRDGDTLRWDAPAPASDGDLPRRYAVYRFVNAAEAATNASDATKLYAITYVTKAALPVGLNNGYFMVASLDKAGNESESGSLIALPVTGLELTVKLSGNVVTVGWTTLTEINTNSFDVERSTDGRNFSRVATRAAAGNSSAPRTYEAGDYLFADGIYHYRIKTVDRDGKVSYSAVKSVAFRNAGNEILVGPNPFQSFVSVSNLAGVKRLEVLDVSGRMVYQKVVNSQATVRMDLPQLPSGIYHLKAVKTDGSQVMVKLVRL